ncbi:MAG: hypothetical protein JW940_32700 [Polyangiaceae bacterium]|nr:hypothetical protein [Polyangiaceae bacterium]
MTEFATKPVMLKDPSLRVNYTFGQVLGVDEFLQEQLHHVEHGRLHHRLLHGYGTVWGLKVEPKSNATPRLHVTPGVAINPLGQEIRVVSDMCADLNSWLAAHQSEVESLMTSPPGTLRLSLVLYYRECKTHPVPIRGEPCQSSEAAVAPSRISSGFELKLCLDEPSPALSPPAEPSGCAPCQAEEDLVRAFGDLLQELEITDSASALFITEQELRTLVLALGCTDEPASPPVAPITARAIHPDEAHAMFDVAFRTWVTDVRPRVIVRDAPGPCEPMRDDAVLLAHIELDVVQDPETSAFAVSGSPRIDETDRPYLLHSRLLQEWLGRTGCWIGRSTVPAPPPFEPPVIPPFLPTPELPIPTPALPIPARPELPIPTPALPIPAPPVLQPQPALPVHRAALTREAAETAPAAARDGSTYAVVAAGRFSVSSGPAGAGAVVADGPTFNGLAASQVAGRARSELLLTFDGYSAPAQGDDVAYLVSGQLEAGTTAGSVCFNAYAATGIRISVRAADSARLRAGYAFSVEVRRITGPR